MTWINFLSFLGMGYAAYYGLLILLERKSAPGKADPVSPVLTFTEFVVPEKISLEDIGLSSPAASSPASIALGGVSIKELFVLARKDAIEFTKSVSF
ncbi:hypothetical protein [Pedobacter sp. GR22-6]|uniref:hypothetical protein n=1 Tax=Pedobacter sp. GR22-6 TaxID=3127957 RepID=UPI00307E53DD